MAPKNIMPNVHSNDARGPNWSDTKPEPNGPRLCPTAKIVVAKAMALVHASGGNWRRNSIVTAAKTGIEVNPKQAADKSNSGSEFEISGNRALQAPPNPITARLRPP